RHVRSAPLGVWRFRVLRNGLGLTRCGAGNARANEGTLCHGAEIFGAEIQTIRRPPGGADNIFAGAAGRSAARSADRDADDRGQSDPDPELATSAVGVGIRVGLTAIVGSTTGA